MQDLNSRDSRTSTSTGRSVAWYLHENFPNYSPSKSIDCRFDNNEEVHVLIYLLVEARSCPYQGSYSVWVAQLSESFEQNSYEIGSVQCVPDLQTGVLNAVPFDPLGLNRDKRRQNEVPGIPSQPFSDLAHCKFAELLRGKVGFWMQAGWLIHACAITMLQLPSWQLPPSIQEIPISMHAAMNRKQIGFPSLSCLAGQEWTSGHAGQCWWDSSLLNLQTADMPDF